MNNELLKVSECKIDDTDKIILSRIFILVDKIKSLNELKILISALEEDYEKRKENIQQNLSLNKENNKLLD